MKYLISITAFILGISSIYGQVKLELLEDGFFKAIWKDKEVISKSKPQLMIDKSKDLIWDENSKTWRQISKSWSPVDRQEHEISIEVVKQPMLIVRDRLNRVIPLGKSKFNVVQAETGALVYTEEFAESETEWALKIEPVNDNSLDIIFEVKTNPLARFTDYGIDLFNMNLKDAKGDFGKLRARKKFKAPSGKYYFLPYDYLWIAYQAGTHGYVPAGVLQDGHLALGVCELGFHKNYRSYYSALNVKKNSNNGYDVSLDSRWSGKKMLEEFYIQSYKKHYRFTFSAPKELGECGYLRLVDAKELWIDYMKEVDQYLPVIPPAEYDRDKCVCMDFFTCQAFYKTPDNTAGWMFKDPDRFPQDPACWLYNEKGRPVTKNMAWSKLRREGYSWKNFGKPVNWIKKYAENTIENMRCNNSQAVIVWNTARAQCKDASYAPESHIFHPELEELMPVEGKIRNWDWAVADVEVINGKGEVIAEKKGALIHAANLENLIYFSIYEKNYSQLRLKAENIRKPGQVYVKNAITSTENKEEQTNYHQKGLYLNLLKPKDKLCNLKAGDEVELTALPVVRQGPLSKEKLTVKATITGIKRAVIDIWAKTLIDAGFEFGFLVQEAFTTGPVFRQRLIQPRWTAEWEYKLMKQRFQWHRERFGPKCRWFYLDVFAGRTPAFILQRLRYDFPNMLFFPEHETDISDRTCAGGMADNVVGIDDLKNYVAPKTIQLLRCNHLIEIDDKELVEQRVINLFSNPNNLLMADHTTSKMLQIAIKLNKEGKIKRQKLFKNLLKAEKYKEKLYNPHR